MQDIKLKGDKWKWRKKEEAPSKLDDVVGVEPFVEVPYETYSFWPHMTFGNHN